MRCAGQELPGYPMIPDANIRKLRAELIMEEALETVKALGFTLENSARDNVSIRDMDDVLLRQTHDPDIIQIADGCGDISVVTIGTLIACGLPDKPLLEAVDESNLAKFGPGGYRNEAGKWIKPPDWVAPPLGEIISRLMEDSKPVNWSPT